MPTNLLTLVNRIRAALEGRGSLTHEQLQSMLGDGETASQLDQALRFLQGREAILIDGVDHSVHLRTHVSRTVMDSIKDGPLPLDELARRAQIDIALVCDVLGWLAREGRVTVSDDDVVSL